MAEPLTLVAVLGTLGGGLALLLAWADRRWASDPAPVVAAVEALLPQTQCAQCGYPGCRPYAEAVAAGEAINLCPPGGEETQQALARLLDRPAGPPPPAPPPQVARIREAECIGCFRCVEACPVDAIVGAPQLMHTVVEDLCTGCELCVEPCPVDCIVMEQVPVPVDPRPLRILSRPRNREPEAAVLPCIRCGACEAVCPESLFPQELHWFCRDGGWAQAAERGLERCIECGLCNQACPSNIDLLADFTRGRQALRAEAEAREAAAAARRGYERHEARTEARRLAWAKRRESRLKSGARRPWLR